MQTKVSIIGHFGGKENFLDGQTIKTKIYYEELRKKTDWNIACIDTYYKRKNPIKLVLQLVWYLTTRKDVIVLVSANGRRAFFPLLGALSKIGKVRVYHSVIGGDLGRKAQSDHKLVKQLNSFAVNWVETGSIKKELEAVGVHNARIMPNFKRLNVAEEASLKTEFAHPLRFCTFSRVMKEKGIEEAVETVEAINAAAGKTVCELDIYGNIDAGYTQRFEEVMAKATPAVQYRGVVPFDKSVEAIKDYYALLFPTYWSGEGFAGTVVDALSAGLPVIATDWNCNGEIVEDMVTGILYPNNQFSSLREAVDWVVQNPEAVAEMKKQCVRSAQRYQPDAYIEKIIAFVESR